MRRKQRIRFDALPDDAADRLSGREPPPDRVFDDRMLDADIQAALDALAPDFRAAVVLCDIEGLSYEEIAATLDVKLGTVRSRIHRVARSAACGARAPGHPLRSTRPSRLPRPGRRRRRAPRERVTALVDDQLGHDDRDRALAHVMNCEQCRLEVERERATKAALRRLADANHRPRWSRPCWHWPSRRSPSAGAAAFSRHRVARRRMARR